MCVRNVNFLAGQPRFPLTSFKRKVYDLQNVTLFYNITLRVKTYK